jgi:hypothetical protein
MTKSKLPMKRSIRTSLLLLNISLLHNGTLGNVLHDVHVAGGSNYEVNDVANDGNTIVSNTNNSTHYDIKNALDWRNLQTLATDDIDDRHGKEPVDSNSTNGPAYTFTRIPSLVPSSSPSYSPSKTPTSFPSWQPSVSPTYFPSTSPSTFPTLDPCIGRDGLFGSTSNSNRKLYVYYKYGIEIDNKIQNEMDVTVPELVAEVEYNLLNELIAEYFSECSKDEGRRMIGYDMEEISTISAQSLKNKKQTLSEVVGLSSKPIDIANGGKTLRL